MLSKIEIQRMDRLLKKIREERSRLARQFQKGALKAMIHLYTKVGEIIPIETGALWETSTVKMEGAGFNTIVTMAFNEPYAVYVHENLTVRHGAAFNTFYVGIGSKSPYTDQRKIHELRRPEEQAKFVETPMHDPTVQLGMIAIINKELRGAGTVSLTLSGGSP